MKRETVGAAIFLLLVLNKQKSGPDFGSLAGDFHRMVGFMEKVDSFGQMAVNPPPLPQPAQLINTDALPDISSLMAMAAPLLANFNSEK